MENTTGNSYNLSIRIKSDGFYLSVYDEFGLLLSSQHIAVSAFNLSADEIIRIMNNEIQLNYKSLNLICESDSYLFIPTPFFKIDEAADLLNFQHRKEDKKERLVVNMLTNWDTVNVFSIPAALEQALTNLFPGTGIEHQTSWLLNHKIKLYQENSLSVWVRSNMLDIVVIKDGKLQLMNSFSYQTPEDFTYHTLNVIELLSLDIEKCKVYLYNSEKKPELEKTLGSYVTVIV